MKKSILLGLAVFFTIATKAQVTIGSGLEPNTGALLDIKEFASTSTNLSTANKGFNLPRVPLQAANKLEPCATTNVTNNRNHTGMFVYNTTTNVQLTPGVYYWNGANWIRMITEMPKSQLNLLNLQVNSITEEGLPDGSGGTILNFGTVIIPDDGSYAFNFRFYGTITDLPTTGIVRVVYYLSVFTDGVLQDTAEINIYPTNISSNRHTYSIALGCTATAGQNVTFKMSHMAMSSMVHSCPWVLETAPGNQANRTSMIWWKL